MIISSKSNPRIKEARSLQSRKGREELDAFLVEGIRPVGEAVSAGVALQAIFYAPELLHSEFALELVQSQQAAGVECLAVTPEVLQSLAEKENPTGLIAVARLRPPELEQLTPASYPWVAALVSPQDPGNIGTILRTMDATGAGALFLLDGGAESTHPSAIRASMGTLFWHPVLRTSFGQFLAWARQGGYHILGTSSHATQEIGAVNAYPRPLALLLGSEQKGLSTEQAANCDTLLRLPMQGRATSLNLAVAAGVFLYDIYLKPVLA